MKMGIVFILLLTGCAVVDADKSNNAEKHKSSDDINNYKYSSSFLLNTYLMKNGCDISKNTAFYAEKELYKDYIDYHIVGESCLNQVKYYMPRICKDLGGVWEEGSNNHWGRVTNWCASENDILFVMTYSRSVRTADAIDIIEKVKGKEDKWRGVTSAIYGAKTVAELREGREKKALEDAFYRNGEPKKVLKSNIGTRICKLDQSSVVYSKDKIFYSGFIENKSPSKILIRFEYHGNKKTVINDVDGVIRWEKPLGWYVCDQG
ncbi:hypothetical protein [Klebsiella sp. BIGb0407]|uniref:hypothetical protein n=1 Tax=Klebsiella sp. BIGb0407 TaxID=2940603 RepID=UPI0021677309|nr:hypothetical protein [Klebsiella sp. BIGb0407]MCS3434254.1 hypothetical protein [Klebsiella sp. BIGb0407]